MDNHRPGSSWRPLIAALVAMLVAALALVCAPAPALARDYSIDAVDIDLTVNTDGSIRIVEEREFNFDGSFNGVYWDIATSAPAETSSDVAPWISDLSVEDLNQSWGAFSEAYSGDPGTYEVGDYYSFTRVKIYTPHEDERARVRISYTMNNVVNAWADTGELYWKFVSDGWDVPSDNVTCRVHLPVPAGVTVTGGDNVRAWGHGPLDASLSFDGNDVVYTVPGVGTDEYAEARIVFPVEWLTDMVPSSTSRLSTIRAEEQQWADEANARRERAHATILVGTSVGAASCVGIVALAALLTLRYRRRHRAQFDDDYFRDVPSDDHPAVLAALWAGGKVPSEAFTATLMKLTDDGIIGLSLVKDDKGRDKDYQIERGDRKAKNDIDSAAMNLLFNVVAPRGKDRRWRDAPAGGYKTLRFSDVKRAAKKAPQTYSEALDEWRDEVSGRCEVRNFFDEDGFTGRAPLLVFSILLACVGVVASVFLLDAEAWVNGLVLLVLNLVACTVACVLATRLRPMSREAIELRAKLAALRKWLKEFTLLGEAVPRDVALWDRLLVMAVVLGVADRVIEQLKVAAPEILADPYFYSYCWYGSYGRLGSPASVITTSYESAHHVSTAAMAASSSSSGGGGGGGFSGGDGGGGGGGGGGGAF